MIGRERTLWRHYQITTSLKLFANVCSSKPVWAVFDLETRIVENVYSCHNCFRTYLTNVWSTRSCWGISSVSRKVKCRLWVCNSRSAVIMIATFAMLFNVVSGNCGLSFFDAHASPFYTKNVHLQCKDLEQQLRSTFMQNFRNFFYNSRRIYEKAFDVLLKSIGNENHVIRYFNGLID